MVRYGLISKLAADVSQWVISVCTFITMFLYVSKYITHYCGRVHQNQDMFSIYGLTIAKVALRITPSIIF